MEAPVVALSDISGFVKAQPWEKVACACGTKASLLGRASNAGLSIPDGFVITKSGCASSLRLEALTLSNSLFESISAAIKKLESTTKLQYGGDNPLLLVISGPSPVIGVPFCGLNDYTVRMLEKWSADKSFAYDCYRRFIRAFGALVWDIPDAAFDEAEDKYLGSRNIRETTRCSALDFVQVTKLHKALIVKYSGVPFPQDVMQQVKAIIAAMIHRFGSEHAALYRSALQDNDKSPAILVTRACFGAWDDKSFAGAISTHNLVSGEAEPTGVFANHAFLDDVIENIGEVLPVANCEGAYPKLVDGVKKISKETNQPITLEFISQGGQLTVVRVMPSKFAGLGRFTAAVQMVKSGSIKKEDVLIGLCPGDLGSLVNSTLKSKPRSCFCSGPAGAYGVGEGALVRSANAAAKKARRGEDVILAARTLRASDVKALVFCNGSIARTGTDYSHGIYHARALSKSACVGCSDITINYDEETVATSNGTVHFGDQVTVADGEVFMTALPSSPLEYLGDENTREVLKWIDDVRNGKMSVLAAAQTLDEVKESLAIGADGIGMFPVDNFADTDQESLVSYFLTRDRSVGAEVGNKLSSAMSDVLSIVQSQVCFIKSLSRPLSGFLPSIEKLVDETTELKVRKQHESNFNRDQELKLKEEMLKDALKVAETNPMMGLRGVRLCLVFPELFAMQCRSILAAAKATRRRGANPQVKILIPSVTDVAEVARLEQVFNDVVLEVDEPAELGVVIGCARAALTAGRLAEVAKLICIDIDALTQTTYGYCESDAHKQFMQQYIDLRILDESPTATIDCCAVGKLMRICVEEAKKTNPNVRICAFGSRCFDRKSIAFCHSIGIQSITCRSAMVPVARLSAAQAMLSPKS